MSTEAKPHGRVAWGVRLLITSAVVEHGMIVGRTLAWPRLQLDGLEAPILSYLHFPLTRFLFRIER